MSLGIDEGNNILINLIEISCEVPKSALTFRMKPILFRGETREKGAGLRSRELPF